MKATDFHCTIYVFAYSTKNGGTMAVETLEEGRAVLQSRTNLARVILYVFLAASAVAALVSLGELGGIVDLDAAEDPVSLTAALGLVLYGLVFLICVIVVGMWIYRAHANLHLVDGVETTISPGWAVGWYFVPVANLFKPYAAMKELWATSHGFDDRFADEGQQPLPTWWGCWIAGNIIANISLRLSMSESSSTLGSTAVLDLASTIISAVACWLLIKIIERVNHAQQSSLGMAEVFA
jgi:Domain of unknown function (DUF4328)